jgi:hypothetical protein
MPSHTSRSQSASCNTTEMRATGRRVNGVRGPVTSHTSHVRIIVSAVGTSRRRPIRMILSLRFGNFGDHRVVGGQLETVGNISLPSIVTVFKYSPTHVLVQILYCVSHRRKSERRRTWTRIEVKTARLPLLHQVLRASSRTHTVNDDITLKKKTRLITSAYGIEEGRRKIILS